MRLGTIFPNADFGTRNGRLAEQIAVMRKLWTEPLVTFYGALAYEDAASAIERLRKFLHEAGRDATSFGGDARIRSA